MVYIKCDFTKLRHSDDEVFVLIGSAYCLQELTYKNRCCFNAIHEISRDFQQVDTEEVDEIISHYIQKYGAKNIRFYTNEDSTQLVCASLCEKYDIPGQSIEALLPFVNKIISKEKLEHAVRMPKFIKFDKKDYMSNANYYLNTLVENLGFPMFAKPIDLVSSIETHKINDLDSLKRICDRIITLPYDFEIDEFIEGDLFHCDAMIIDDKIEFFMVGKCSYALSRFFEGKPVGSIPIADSDLFRKLKSFCEVVFKKLNCHSGAY